MSWNDWLDTIKSYKSVNANESAIYTIQGERCIAGDAFNISADEFQGLVKAITTPDSSTGRMINSKKYLPVGRLGDGQGNFRSGKETYCVNVGSKYVVILKVADDSVCEAVVSHCNTLIKSLHQ